MKTPTLNALYARYDEAVRACCASSDKSMDEVMRLATERNAAARAINDRVASDALRELKAEVATTLRWALAHIGQPSLVKGQNDTHHYRYEKAKALLARMEAK